MIIAFDAKRIFQNFTGLGNYGRTYVRNLANYFPENFYHLYTPSVTRNTQTDFFLSNPCFKTIVPAENKSLWWRSYYMTKDLKKHGINLFHGLSNELPLNITKKNIRTVVTIHDVIFKFLPQTYFIWDRKIYDYKTSYACKNADKIIAISENTKKDLIKYYQVPEHKIEIIYQACDPIFYEQPSNIIPSETVELPQQYFLYVGSIIERKNLLLILKAYNTLHKNDRIPLVVVGNDKTRYAQKIKKYILEYSLQPWVIWLPNICSVNQLTYIYKKASALIYPSSYEGFGLPVLEAILCKTPVIALNKTSLPEAGGKYSYYLESEKPEELAEFLKWVLCNQQTVQYNVENAFDEAINKFNPKLLSEKAIKIYSEIMS